MCPICDCKEFRIIGSPKADSKSSKIIRYDYKVVQCNKCSLYYINPLIDFSGEEWKYLYDEDYFGEMSNWYIKTRQKDMLKRFDNIEKYSSNKISTYLDIGCGEGYCLLEAEKRGWNAYGIDITDNRINEARKNSIIFRNSTLIESKFESNFFDVIYMDSVLEHVINPMEYLIEIERILKKDGILYLALPDEDSLLNDVKKIIYRLTGNNFSSRIKPFLSPYHVIGFNQKSLPLSVRRANLKVIKMRNFACRLEFLRSKTFSRNYFHSLLLLPIYLLAVPFKKEVYLELFAQKV